MNNKAKETIIRYNMLNEGDSVCVALSGGADSVSLFHFLHQNMKELGIAKLYACHLNHNLRGAESDRDQHFAENLCRTYDTEIIVRSADINLLAQQTGKSIEEAARDARYELFADVHREKHCKIATAHSLSDCMETAVFNLARGTGLKGICGITPVRDYIIRPLIRCSRADVEKYCKENHLDYVTDSTNLEDEYTRNRIRHYIIPKLYELNPNAESAFMRFFVQGEREQDYMDLQTDKAYDRIICGEKYLCDEYTELHEAIAFRVLAKILSDKGIDVSFQRLELLNEKIHERSGAVQLNKEYYLIVSNKYFEVSKQQKREKQNFCQRISFENGNTEYIADLPHGKKLFAELIQCEQSIKFENFSKKDLKNLIDCAKIKGDVFIRYRQDGDKVTLNGRGCTKTLKKLFNESRIPAADRDNIPLICDEKDILWIEGFGSSVKTAVSEKTNRFITVKILED